MVFVVINGNKERIDNFCGSEMPSQLMSNGPSFRVEFRSLKTSGRGRGFKASYKFITDFGVTGGVQDQRRGGTNTKTSGRKGERKRWNGCLVKESVDERKTPDSKREVNANRMAIASRGELALSLFRSLVLLGQSPRES